jgi:hypothetical protein
MPGRPALRVKTKKSASHGCLDGNLPSAEIGGKSNRLARGRDSEPRNTGETHQFLWFITRFLLFWFGFLSPFIFFYLCALVLSLFFFSCDFISILPNLLGTKKLDYYCYGCIDRFLWFLARFLPPSLMPLAQARAAQLSLLMVWKSNQNPPQSTMLLCMQPKPA